MGGIDDNFVTMMFTITIDDIVNDMTTISIDCTNYTIYIWLLLNRTVNVSEYFLVSAYFAMSMKMKVIGIIGSIMMILAIRCGTYYISMIYIYHNIRPRRCMYSISIVTVDKGYSFAKFHIFLLFFFSWCKSSARHRTTTS